MASGNDTFEIGLAMSGAISAGAYSAGVLDFLFQALDAWEQEKSSNPGSVPNHNVCMKVIAGASAGAVTGALGAAVLAGGLDPMPYPGVRANPPYSMQPFQYVMPSLYAAWVLRPDMDSLAGGPDLLDTSDLVEGQPIVSLLNSTLLDQIGEDSLRIPSTAVRPIFGPKRNGGLIPYVAKRLHIYMTVSNLRGVPYKVSFKGAGVIRGHGMMSHGDRAHYVLTGLGSADRPSEWGDSDTATFLDVSMLPSGAGTLSEDWSTYVTAALASAAFPVGLAPRTLTGSTYSYEGRMWPFEHDPTHDISPDWPASWNDGKTGRPYGFVSIDGGLFNNDPFDYSHFALLEKGRSRNPRPPDIADRAVILVSPFPEDPYFDTDDTKLAPSLVKTLTRLLSVMKEQARFNPSELALALDEDVYSRFLIAPQRTDSNRVLMKYGIATGLLGGFGGFLDRSLREFDYQLGRRNCQKFLKDTFLLAPENPLFTGWSPDAKNDPSFNVVDNARGRFRSIIPLVGSARPEVGLSNWPKLSAARLEHIENRIRDRANTLGPRLVEEQITNRFLRAAAKLLWRGLGVKAIQEWVHLTIQQDLIARDQHTDWELESDDERSVMAALSDPAFDYRTLVKIVAATGVRPEIVATTLAKYSELIYVAPKAAPNGADAYTLASRKGSWFSRNVWSFVNPPTIDS
jgi:hypothetical protein